MIYAGFDTGTGRLVRVFNTQEESNDWLFSGDFSWFVSHTIKWITEENAASFIGERGD